MNFEKKILLFEKKLNTTTYKLNKGIFFPPSTLFYKFLNIYVFWKTHVKSGVSPGQNLQERCSSVCLIIEHEEEKKSQSVFISCSCPFSMVKL